MALSGDEPPQEEEEELLGGAEATVGETETALLGGDLLGDEPGLG